MGAFNYRMKDLAKILDRTQARIYDYFKEDKEFYYSENHRIKDNKKGFIYDEEVLERLKNKLLIENGVGIEENKKEASNIPNISPRDEETKAIKEELEEMRNKYEELKARYEEVEAERKQLLEQNSNILLLLSQEKAEKQARQQFYTQNL